MVRSQTTVECLLVAVEQPAEPTFIHVSPPPSRIAPKSHCNRPPSAQEGKNVATPAFCRARPRAATPKAAARVSLGERHGFGRKKCRVFRASAGGGNRRALARYRGAGRSRRPRDGCPTRHGAHDRGDRASE